MRVALSHVAWIVVVGCSASPEIGSVIESDSSGVRIVEYPAGLAEGQIHRLEPVPITRIGEADGDGPYLLSQVAGALELEQGALVVADATSRELRWFDLDGGHLFSSGGAGDGPGEFGSLGGVHQMHGDTLIALDGRRPTLSWFSPEGEFVTSVSMEEIPDAGPTPDGGYMLEVPTILGAFENGDLLAHGHIAWPDVPTGIRNDSIPILRFDRTGGEWHLLGQVGGIEFFVYRDAGENEGMVRPFGRWPRVGIGTDWYVVGRGDGQGIRIHDQQGTLTGWIRPNLSRRPVDQEAIRQERDASLERLSPQFRERQEMMWEAVPLPGRMPSHGPILVGGGEEIWVRSYAENLDGGFRWYVFTRSGRYLHAVDVPVGLRVLSVGDERLIAVQHDEFDVPQVVIFRRPTH